MTLHKNTFGKSKAAEILTEKLNNYGDDNLSRKIGKYLTIQFSTFCALKDISNIKSREYLFHLLKKQIQSDIDNRFESKVPKDVLTYMANILKARVREEYRNLNNLKKEYAREQLS